VRAVSQERLPITGRVGVRPQRVDEDALGLGTIEGRDTAAIIALLSVERRRTMHTSTKALLVGAALLTIGGTSIAGAGSEARVHAALPANPCAAVLPANRILSTTGGIQTYTTLHAGRYTFDLNQFGPQGLDKQVRLFGVTLPADDAVASWSFTLPGGTRTYAGLAHVFHYGAQGGALHACLWGGVGYLNLGHGGAAAAHAPVVAVTLDALVGVRTGQPGHVDLHVNGAHYTVTGYLRVR